MYHRCTFNHRAWRHCSASSRQVLLPYLSANANVDDDIASRIAKASQFFGRLTKRSWDQGWIKIKSDRMHSYVAQTRPSATNAFLRSLSSLKHFLWRHKSFMCRKNGCYEKKFVRPLCGHGPISQIGWMM